jgi:hypothetical protein
MLIIRSQNEYEAYPHLILPSDAIEGAEPDDGGRAEMISPV